MGFHLSPRMSVWPGWSDGRKVRDARCCDVDRSRVSLGFGAVRCAVEEAPFLWVFEVGLKFFVPEEEEEVVVVEL